MSVLDRRTLGNGVRLLLAPMPHAQSAASFVGFATGSRYEDAASAGYAHFVEHMLFTGTERRPSMTELSSEVDALGAHFNASTRKDATSYWVRSTAEHTRRALDILVDMVRHSRFDAGELEREKGVIGEEMNMIYSSPREYVDEHLEALLYGDTPLGRPVIGARETVTGAGRDDLLEFVRRWYTAQRLVVGVAGGFDESVVADVEDLLGDLEPGNGRFEPAAPLPARRVRLEEKDGEQAEIALGARALPLGHPDRHALDLLRAVLGGGMSSRLYRELVSTRGLAYSISVVMQRYVDAGGVWAQGGVSADKAVEAVSAVVSELRRLAEEPVPGDELDKARNFAKGRFVFQTETPQGLMSWALRREVIEGETVDPEEVLAALDAVTVEDVHRVAADLFAPGALRLAVIGPFDDAEPFERLLP